jgi:cytochrome c oxidase subunit IV
MKKILNVHTIWVILVMLTLSTYLFGHFHSTGNLIVFMIVLIAIIKSIFIMREFMGLKGVSLLWKMIMYGWLMVVSSAILIAYAVSV